MKKVHHVLVDVLRDAPRWRDFAIKVKQGNIKRPAFQEEFAKAVPGWQALK
jgi:transposase